MAAGFTDVPGNEKKVFVVSVSGRLESWEVERLKGSKVVLALQLKLGGEEHAKLAHIGIVEVGKSVDKIHA